MPGKVDCASRGGVHALRWLARMVVLIFAMQRAVSFYGKQDRFITYAVDQILICSVVRRRI